MGSQLFRGDNDPTITFICYLYSMRHGSDNIKEASNAEQENESKLFETQKSLNQDVPATLELIDT